MNKAIACFASILLLIATGTLAENPTPQAANLDVSTFPVLQGRLKELLGHEGGYIRPKPGEPCTLDLRKLLRIGSQQKLDFDPQSKSYIPLPGPTTIESVHYYGNGSFESLRLISQNDRVPSSRTVIDIHPLASVGKGPDHVAVWIVMEYDGQTRGVVLIDAKASGELPRRP